MVAQAQAVTVSLQDLKTGARTPFTPFANNNG